jgi:hypothetical protein
MDDPDVEITDLRRPGDSSDHQPTSWMGIRAKRGRRLAVAIGSIVLAVLVVAGAWLPLHERGLDTGAQSSHATPLPITGLLAAPPTNCPASPPLDALTVSHIDGFTPDTVPLLGRSPVWVVSDSPSLRVGTIVQPPAASPSWPEIKILWVFGPTRHPHVTVRATDLRSGDVAWWAVRVPRTPQVPTLTMDPDVEFPDSAQLTWVAAVTTLIITHAGCYELAVSWAGGGWQTVFAAGQIPR